MNHTKSIVLTALGIALVFLATYILKIPNGLQGYFNLGDGFIAIFASLLNPFYSFLIGGVGSALADVAGGYSAYIIPTLLTKGLEAIVISFIVYKKNNNISRIIAYILGGIIMILGYLISEIFMYGAGVAVAAIPTNLIQAIAGIVIAIIAYPIIKRLYTSYLS